VVQDSTSSDSSTCSTLLDSVTLSAAAVASQLACRMRLQLPLQPSSLARTMICVPAWVRQMVPAFSKTFTSSSEHAVAAKVRSSDVRIGMGLRVMSNPRIV
jgi:hypothetical protein